MQALCRPSSAVVMHARKHLALKLAQRGKASKAKVPHVDKPIFVSEGKQRYEQRADWSRITECSQYRIKGFDACACSVTSMMNASPC